MESGSRISVAKETFAIAVDYDVVPATKYQLIDIAMVWDAAPDDSELVTIFTIREGVKVIEYSFDPSLSTDVQHIIRFDKRFDKVPYGIDYVNTGTDSIDVYSTYQHDNSV